MRREICLGIAIFAVFFVMWAMASTVVVRDARITASDIHSAKSVLGGYTLLQNPQLPEVVSELNALGPKGYLEVETSLIDDACSDLQTCQTRVEWICPKIGDSAEWVHETSEQGDTLARITKRAHATVCEARCKRADGEPSEIVPIITLKCEVP